jgi:hypothetical protein
MPNAEMNLSNFLTTTESTVKNIVNRLVPMASL